MREDSAGEEEEMKIAREQRRDSKQRDESNDDEWAQLKCPLLRLSGRNAS